MAVDELLRRKREERYRYIEPSIPADPVPFDGIEANDQLGFLLSEADERWIFGGNRSGKTEMAVYDCLLLCLGEHPVRSKHRKPPVNVRYCGPQWRETIGDVVLPKFQQMVPRHVLRGGSWAKAWVEKDHSLYFENGSVVHFKTFEEKKSTFGGKDLDAVYQDECGPEEYYQENQARLVDRDGYFVAALTPELGVTWEDDHVKDPPPKVSLDYRFFTTYGNPHLSKAGIEKLEGKLRDPAIRAAKLKGEFVPLSGRVMPMWDPDVAIIPDRKLHKSAYRVFCIDLHHRTPSAAMWAAWEPDGNSMRLVVYRCVKAFKTLPEWQKFIRITTSERIDLWLADEPGGGEGLDINEKESLVAQLNQGPDAIPVMQVTKDAERSYNAGIFRLWDLMTVDQVTNKTRFYVFKSCLFPTFYFRGKPHGDLAWELKRFRYKREQKQDEENLREKVAKVNDHLFDDARYIGINGPGTLSKQQPESALTDAWD